MAKVYPKDYFQDSGAIKVQRASSFVIMPFAKKFNEVYDNIKEVLQENLNIQCNRGDEIRQPHIIETILNQIVHSEYIIADLTEANANVFYELGLAHCMKDADNVIMLTQEMEYVPFDLRQFRCITYEHSIAGLQKLREELVKTFNELAKDVFLFRIKENESVLFDKRLVGERDCFYELKFYCFSLGYDGIKIRIEITRFGFDSPYPGTKMPSQDLFLGEHKPTEKINYIPWTVTLVKTHGKAAVISIEKQ